MSLKHALIAELQMEAASTKKILERVPTDKSDWKPHEKSMKLGRLASHVAELPSWIMMVMTTEGLDLSKMDYKPLMNGTNAELVALLDNSVNGAVAALKNSTDEEFDKMWTLSNGEHVIFTMPKNAVVRSSALSHMYHHRGQLGVYLRLLDVPVPGMYGPTADEIPMRAPAAVAN